jgi:uncharacterized protein
LRSDIRLQRRLALLSMAGWAALGLPLHVLARELTSADYRGAPKDLVLWGQLAKVGITRDSGRIKAQFLPEARALDGRKLTLVGFMTPVAAGEAHQRFLLSSRPLDCSHCVPLGAAEIVEVNARGKEWSRQLPVLVRGRLVLVGEPVDGPIYKLNDAVILDRGK